VCDAVVIVVYVVMC